MKAALRDEKIAAATPGYVRFKVSTALLEQVLRLPPGVSISAVQTSLQDCRDGVVQVMVSAKDFPPLAPGTDPPDITPICHQVGDRIDWTFGDVHIEGA